MNCVYSEAGFKALCLFIRILIAQIPFKGETDPCSLNPSGTWNMRSDVRGALSGLSSYSGLFTCLIPTLHCLTCYRFTAGLQIWGVHPLNLFFLITVILAFCESFIAVAVQLLSHVWLCVTPWTVARQASLSMGFSRQECWSALPLFTPRESSQPRDRTSVSCIGREIPYHWAAGVFPNKFQSQFGSSSYPFPPGQAKPCMDFDWGYNESVD